MKKQLIYVSLVLLLSCVDDINHKDMDVTIPALDKTEKTEITFLQLFNLHNKPIGRDTIVSGYVVSSDLEGNFFKEMYVQNTAGVVNLGVANPRMGLRIRVGSSSVNTLYAKGRKVIINLEGLKKTTSNGVLTLGNPSGNFIKDILEFDLDFHLLKTEKIKEITPKKVAISEITKYDLNTLIRHENIHFKEEELGLPLADLPTDDFDGNRVLESCEIFRKDSVLLETSNFSDFASNIIPNSQLDIEGVYTLNFDKKPVLRLNSFEDISVVDIYQKCKMQTPNVFMSEIADPENASASRFVELHNSENVDVNLKGWSLKRYNNGGVASAIPLDNLVIEANSFIIISNHKESTEVNLNFKDVFGFEPDLINSKLDGNGNDAYGLFDEKNELIDVFGNIDIDGTNQDWEYTDGRAYRNINIREPNSVFTIEQWTVVKGNQKAPDNFSPYQRKENEVPVLLQTAPLLITEVADPKEQATARFVEIYNPTEKDVSLDNWLLVRYNYTKSKNTKELASLPISLHGLLIPSKGFVIITKDEVGFQNYFGIQPDLESSKLDGNGDDAYELVDPFETVIDVFGDVNFNGKGSVWEYTDGVGVRIKDVSYPNSVFDVSEWNIDKKKTSARLQFSPKVR